MAQATMTVRTDAEVKAQFTNLCERFGMSVNTAMNVFMRAVMESRCIPFTIGAPSRSSEKEELMSLMEENRQRRIHKNLPEFSLDEINTEIAASRAEGKTKHQSFAV